jgi:hypothetical protein
MMEYLLLSLFILLIIIVMVFFLSWWQFSQFGMEQQRMKNQRTEVLASRFINSPLFVTDNSVFDDSRLMGIQSLGLEYCSELEPFFGGEWFLRIDVLSPRPGCQGPCDASSYPCCGSWEICGQGKRNITRVLPVNIFRHIEDRMDLGLLTVGVYS